MQLCVPLSLSLSLEASRLSLTSLPPSLCPSLSGGRGGRGGGSASRHKTKSLPSVTDWVSESSLSCCVIVFQDRLELTNYLGTLLGYGQDLCRPATTTFFTPLKLIKLKSALGQWRGDRDNYVIISLCQWDGEEDFLEFQDNFLLHSPQEEAKTLLCPHCCCPSGRFHSIEGLWHLISERKMGRKRFGINSHFIY